MKTRSNNHNEECPSCRLKGHDSTGDHLIVYEEGNTHCPRCGYGTNAQGVVVKKGNFSKAGSGVKAKPSTNLTFDNPTPTTKPRYTDEEILKLPQLQIRDVKEAHVIKYGVHTEVDPMNREVTKHFYPVYSKGKLLTWKIREVTGKKFFTLSKTKGHELDFFGQDTLKGKIPKHLVIVEGEVDAMAASLMLQKIAAPVDVVSLPTGANTSAIVTHLKMLQKVGQVYTCLDQDKVGKETTEAIWKLLPSIKVMEFNGGKDADEMLTNMKSAEFIDSFTNADTWKPNTVLAVSDIKEDIAVPLQYGLDYPWDALTELTYGLRTGQIIGICSAPGAGKSTLMKGIQQKIMFDHKIPIGVIDTENPAWKVRRQIVGYIMNQKIWLPGAIYDGAEAKRIEKTLEQKAYFYAHNYYEGTWGELELTIRYLHSIGVKYIFIDPLSSLVAHLSPSEANHWLSDAMYKMSLLIQVLDITIFHSNHLNGGADGKNSHESGGRIYAAQITGSRAQWRFSTDIWAIERDQHALVEDDRNTNNLRILKDRDVGNAGKCIPLLYNGVTGRLDDKPVPTTFTNIL